MEVTTAPDDPYPAWFENAKRGDVNTLMSLADKVLDKNQAQEETGNTALHIAAAAGHVEVVHYLIACEVDINIQNKKKETALKVAAYNGNHRVAQLLIGAKAEYRNSTLSLGLKAAKSKDSKDMFQDLMEQENAKLDKHIEFQLIRSQSKEAGLNLATLTRTDSQKQHAFEKATFHTPNICFQCDKPIWGVFGKQGFRCAACSVTVHENCKGEVPKNCGKPQN